jgi:hypothetical protein
VIGLVLLSLAFPIVLKETCAPPDHTFSMVNPGPGSWTNSWTAETPNPSEIGTANFTFNYPKTNVCNTFFINVTIANAERIKGWGIGIVFDGTKLEYNGSRRPPDHAFAPVESSSVPVPQVLDDVDATHKILKWGFGYIMPTPAWTFNGTGTLCQVRFHILTPVNATYPKWSTWLTFDPDWTTVYQYPTGSPVPQYNSARVQYLYPITPKATTLTISPGSVVDPSLTPCHSFTVNLTVNNAADLYRWQAQIYYSNQILNATDAEEGSFLQTYGTTIFQANILQDFNSTHGQITLSQTLSGAGIGAYGDGQLAAITFHVLGNGSTPITISNDTLYDSENTGIVHTTGNGYFSNILLAEICVEPSEIRDPTLVPGTYFDINVTVGGVQNLKQCTFNLTYNPQVMMETAIVVPKVLGQTPMKYLLADDYNGYIWVNLTYPNPITTNTNVTVLTVTFQVQAMGVSPLNLNNTMMQDASGNPIPHEVCSGMFIGLIVDVAVTRIETDKTVAYAGWLVQINVTVGNEGNTTETFDVKTYYDTNLIDTKTVTALDQNNETTVTFVWNTTTVPPCHNYTISAEIPPLPYETNLTNNSLTDGTVKIKMMGDVDGDGAVNMSDIFLVLDAFGTTPIHHRWNPDADLYPDNKIDMTDIFLVLENFAKTC